jgi:uncharacterized protein YaeQ
MALGSTIYTFDVQLANVDRGVYETLSFRAAQHPSEALEYFIARVLAYCLEFAEGIGFSKGVADPDEPTVSVRDLTGAITTWIEIGAPDAARLHKASKAAPRVVVYTHKDPRVWLQQLQGARIHRAAEIEIYAFDRDLIAGMAERLDRRMHFDLSLTDAELYVTAAGTTLSGPLTPHSL